jgi:hypothetical protein
MSTAHSIVLDGFLKPDGTIQFDTPPDLPPGRVRVALHTLEPSRGMDRLPDGPWLDHCIPAPFDLPHAGNAQPVQPRTSRERLPEPFEWSEGIDS